MILAGKHMKLLCKKGWDVERQRKNFTQHVETISQASIDTGTNLNDMITIKHSQTERLHKKISMVVKMTVNMPTLNETHLELTAWIRLKENSKSKLPWHKIPSRISDFLDGKQCRNVLLNHKNKISLEIPNLRWTNAKEKEWWIYSYKVRGIYNLYTYR